MIRSLRASSPANEAVDVDLAFATPILTSRPSNGSWLNSKLEPLIVRRMEGSRSVQASNVGGWHSDHQLMRWGGTAAKSLAATVKAIVEPHTLNVLDPDAGAPSWLIRAWANVGGNGDYNMPHSHGRSFWSAIYYVRVDEGAGGELVLHDPRLPQTEMHAPHLRFAQAGTQRLSQIRPEPGLLVIVPSWLMHSVRPFQTSGLRISVAMNLAVPDR